MITVNRNACWRIQRRGFGETLEAFISIGSLPGASVAVSIRPFLISWARRLPPEFQSKPARPIALAGWQVELQL